MCGRAMEGEGDICEACQEIIRAEALGRQRKVAKEAQKELEKLSVREKKGPAVKRSVLSPKEEKNKKPHHFKSMAEYLRYLREKEK